MAEQDKGEATGQKAMTYDTPEPVSLECDHCGGDAITSKTGWFADGDGTHCDSCGKPGCVSVDDADEDDVCAYWNSDDGPCTDESCDECHPKGEE